MGANEIAILVKARDQASAVLAGVREKAGAMGDAFTAAAKVVVIAGAAITAAVVTLGIVAVKAASDLNESQNKVAVVFGQSAKVIQDWAKTAAESLGISQQKALEAAGTFGNLFVTMGLGQKPAADMSTAIVGLAADLASFNNANPEEVLIALRSGLVGEIEPLRRFGIAINEETVQLKAMEMGLAKSKDSLSEAAKVQARYALILAQTGTAQGDFARTSEGVANTTRRARAQFEDMQATIGTKLLPIIGPLFNEFVKGISSLNTYLTGDEFAAFAATAIGHLNALLKGGQEAFNILRKIVGDALGEIGRVWATNQGTMSGVAGAFWKTVVSVGAIGLTALGDIVQTGMAALRGDWATAWKGLGIIAARFTDGLARLGGDIGKVLVHALLNPLKVFLEQAANAVEYFDFSAATSIRTLARDLDRSMSDINTSIDSNNEKWRSYFGLIDTEVEKVRKSTGITDWARAAEEGINRIGDAMEKGRKEAEDLMKAWLEAQAAASAVGVAPPPMPTKPPPGAKGTGGASVVDAMRDAIAAMAQAEAPALLALFEQMSTAQRDLYSKTLDVRAAEADIGVALAGSDKALRQAAEMTKARVALERDLLGIVEKRVDAELAVGEMAQRAQIGNIGQAVRALEAPANAIRAAMRGLDAETLAVESKLRQMAIDVRPLEEGLRGAEGEMRRLEGVAASYQRMMDDSTRGFENQIAGIRTQINDLMAAVDTPEVADKFRQLRLEAIPLERQLATVRDENTRKRLQDALEEVRSRETVLRLNQEEQRILAERAAMPLEAQIKRLREEQEKALIPLRAGLEEVNKQKDAQAAVLVHLSDQIEAHERNADRLRRELLLIDDQRASLTEQLKKIDLQKAAFEEAAKKIEEDLLPAVGMVSDAHQIIIDRMKAQTDELLKQIEVETSLQALMAQRSHAVGGSGGGGGGGIPQWALVPGNTVGFPLPGGGRGSFDVPGLQHGGSFLVPGVGAPDSRLVAFRASPGERVNVSSPGSGEAIVFQIVQHGPFFGWGDWRAKTLEAIRDLQASGALRSLTR